MKDEINSYHGNQSEKDTAIANAIRHSEKDMLAAGTYGVIYDSFKGCSVGCDAFDITGQVEASPHKITADHFGFPEWLERLRDTIFEGLPEDKRAYWHSSLKKAVPVGLDEVGFEKVKAKFLIFILKNSLKTVGSLSISDELRVKIVDAINQCISAQERSALTGEVAKVAAESAARAAAWSATESAARATAEAARAARTAAELARAAAWAPWSAARAAGSAARAASWSATDSAEAAARAAAEAAVSVGGSAESAARVASWSVGEPAESPRSSVRLAAESAAFVKYSEKMIELLNEADSGPEELK